MILDPNILLRLVDGDTGPHYQQARERLETALEGGERLRVDPATIHEVVYVLRSQATGYGYRRTEVAATVHWLIDAPELEVENAGPLHRAATDYGASTNIDFHDYYLAARARDLGEEVFSLDGDLKKLEP